MLQFPGVMSVSLSSWRVTWCLGPCFFLTSSSRCPVLIEPETVTLAFEIKKELLLFMDHPVRKQEIPQICLPLTNVGASLGGLREQAGVWKCWRQGLIGELWNLGICDKIQQRASALDLLEQ